MKCISLRFSQVGLRILNGNGFNVYGCCKLQSGVGGNTRQLCTGQLSMPAFCRKSSSNQNLLQFGKTFKRQLHDKTSNSFGGAKVLERFRRRDGVPNSYRLIYRSNLPNYLFCSQIFIFLTIGSALTAGLLYLLVEMTEEEKRLRKEKQLLEIDIMKQKEKESRLGQFVASLSESTNITSAETHSPPTFRDMIIETEEPLVLVALAVSFIGLAAALFKIQRIVPVRIYMGIENKKHCIAIMYGHVLPGRLTWHEFMAGTLKPFAFIKGNAPVSIVDNAVFKDGSGKTLVIMDKFFHSSAEYNKVMGFDKEQEDEEDEEIRNRR